MNSSLRSSKFLLALFILTSSSFAFGKTIRVPNINTSVEPWTPYVQELLRNVLAVTKKNTEVDTLTLVNGEVAQDRALQQLRDGKDFDIFWTMTSRSRETNIHTVRIPLLKGMLGHRVIIIRKGDEKRFASVKTFDDLTKISMGQGQDWPDTAIMKAAGMKVVASANYSGLFKMLESKRFDGFPQGINEAWAELEDKNVAGLELKVEETIALVYPAPIFFFVKKENTGLIERVEKGLQILLRNGQFDKLFYKYWEADLKRANLKHRKIFRIDNPELTPETAQVFKEHPEYFIDIQH